jgi:hypothetical protein
MNKIIFFISFLILGCSIGKDPIESDINSIVTETESNYKNFTEAQWEENNQMMEELTIQFQQNRENYTPEQIKEINKAIGRYQAIQLKRGIKEFENAISDFGQQLEGAAEELADTTKY